MAKLILMRHGESVWNKSNVFTGWVDIPLTQKGIEEALKAGERIANVPFGVIYVSSLIRAQLTAMLAMSRSHRNLVPCVVHENDQEFMKLAKVYDPKALKQLIPVYEHHELNERRYGTLQGLNKGETLKQYGEEQFKLWRRSYRGQPPEGESLEMTAKKAKIGRAHV